MSHCYYLYAEQNKLEQDEDLSVCVKYAVYFVAVGLSVRGLNPESRATFQFPLKKLLQVIINI